MQRLKLLFTAITLIFEVRGEQPIQDSQQISGEVPTTLLPAKDTDFEQKTIQSKGISLEQLLSFTRGLLASDVVETSFKLADKNKDGLLNDDEAQQASVIGNALAQYRVQEQLTEAEKTQDGLIELDEAKLVAQRVGLDGADSELASAVDKDGLLTSDDVEQVINSNANRTQLNSSFARFDDNGDGNWSQTEMDKFLSVMRIDRPRWMRILREAQIDYSPLTFGDFQRALQLYS